MKHINEIYELLLNNKKKAAFVGQAAIRDYLCYVLGNKIQMSCYRSIAEISENEDVFIVDDITENTDAIIKKSVIRLSDFVDVLNAVNIPQDRPIALWGGGFELKSKLRIIRKYCSPSIIIDTYKTGIYENIPFVSPNEIDVKKYFIIITTTEFAGDIKEKLKQYGCLEGKDYMLGTDPNILNDNAEMFVQTITDRPIKKNLCRRPFDYVNVGIWGNLTHCCYQWLPKYVGNVLNDDKNVCDTITSRIIRVSFMNQTYSFCNTLCCPWMAKEREKMIIEADSATNTELYMQKQKIIDIDVAFDNTCNLCCKSCRSDFVVDKSQEPIKIAERISKDLIPNASRLTVAGNGEVFLSKAYAHIFDGIYPNVKLTVLSNGNLFTAKKWKTIEGRFKEITLMFSIDAATKETYEEIRYGGKWEKLVRGLNTASDLKKRGKISRFIIRFVVSSKNYQEMPEFVQLGIDINCDVVDFTRIENWGTYTDEEFAEISMFHGENPKKELQAILDLPIMRNPIVRFTNIKSFNRFDE